MYHTKRLQVLEPPLLQLLPCQASSGSNVNDAAGLALSALRHQIRQLCSRPLRRDPGKLSQGGVILMDTRRTNIIFKNQLRKYRNIPSSHLACLRLVESHDLLGRRRSPRPSLVHQIAQGADVGLAGGLALLRHVGGPCGC